MMVRFLPRSCLFSPIALCAQSSKWISIKIIQAALATPITQFQATLRGRHLPYDVAQTENVAEWRTSVCSSHASEHRRPLANDKQFVNFTEKRFITLRINSRQHSTHHWKSGKECNQVSNSTCSLNGFGTLMLACCLCFTASWPYSKMMDARQVSFSKE